MKNDINTTLSSNTKTSINKLNVFHWMITFLTVLSLILFWVIIDKQRKVTMANLSKNDNSLDKDVNSAVMKHKDFKFELEQMSTTQRNHKDSIDTNHAQFIKTRNSLKDEIDRLFYKLDELDRRFNNKLVELGNKLDDEVYSLSGEIADLRSQLRKTNTDLKNIKDLVDKHELKLYPPKEEKDNKKRRK